MKLPRWLGWMLPRLPLVRPFTPRAGQALALSRRVAFEHDPSGAVDTQHLLAALLRLGPSGVTSILQEAGIDIEELQTSLERPSAPPATPEAAMRMPFLPSIKRSLAIARREARKLGDTHVGIEHLLLAFLACGQGQAANVLTSKGLTLERTRTILRAMQTAPAGEPSPLVLVMFDVDGTLTESFDLDSATYVDALREVFDFTEVSDDWATYRHVTDGGILAELFGARLGRVPTQGEIDAMRTRFTELLDARVAAAGGLREMAGAAQILSRLRGEPDKYTVAYASGGWGATARLKLRAAGLPVDDVPGAFADDDVSREGICRAARRRAQERAGHELPRVVYIGDGPWDVRTSRNLGYGFIGIGRDAGAARLRSEGAMEVLPDFQDAAVFFAALERVVATLPPASSRSGEITASAR